MKKTINIAADAPYPASVLSNFAANEFMFDGVPCASMEGLLQAFKFPFRPTQLIMCGMTALDAKFAGRRGNGWKKTQRLHWGCESYDRHSPEYQNLLDRAFHALATNENFTTALLATGNAKLVHRIGSDDPQRTVLTRNEFIDRLLQHRLVLQSRRAN